MLPMIPQIVLNNMHVIVIAGLFLGLDKGGLKPLLVIATYLLLQTFSPQTMLAILSPLLVVGEIFPMYHYREQANRPVANKILVWMIVGVIVGTIVGSNINTQIFCLLIGIFIVVMGITNIIIEKTQHFSEISQTKTAILGFLGGLGSLIGNAAGGITNIYFLSTVKNKNALLGSSSYLYVVINSIKIVFYLAIWKIYSIDTLAITLSMIPFLMIGVLIATAVIKIMPEFVFKIVFYISVFYAGIALILGAL